MITDVFAILENLINNDYTFRTLSETTLDGEIVKTYSTPISIRSAIIPFSGQELKNTPEGQYTFEDTVILTDKNSVLKVGDIAVFGGTNYEIKNEIDLGELVNIKKFLAKRISDETSIP
jgi:hypothetical protein